MSVAARTAALRPGGPPTTNVPSTAVCGCSRAGARWHRPAWVHSASGAGAVWRLGQDAGAGGAQPGVSEAEERPLSSVDPQGLAELQLGSGHIGPVDAARGKGLSSCMSAREG